MLSNPNDHAYTNKFLEGAKVYNNIMFSHSDLCMARTGARKIVEAAPTGVERFELQSWSTYLQSSGTVNMLWQIVAAPGALEASLFLLNRQRAFVRCSNSVIGTVSQVVSVF